MGLKEQDIVFTTTDENGDKVLQLPITRYENVEGILDFVYPIGSLYWSKNAADPSTLFGGTWERIKDTFILAAGDSYEAGSTGGEASHTLTADEMPSHSHSGSTDNSSVPDHYHAWGYHTGNNNGRFLSTGGTTADYSLASGTNGAFWNGSGGGGNSGQSTSGLNLITSLAKTASGTTGSHSHTLTIDSSGGGVAHNNMPPYATYYCWERTA